jgi:hypothetical protein
VSSVGEQLVGGIGAGTGQRVEQRGLARVGVATSETVNASRRARDRRRVRRWRSLRSRRSRTCRIRPREHATVHLELGLGGAAAHAMSARAASPGGSTPARAATTGAAAGELDLQLALGAARALAEDVQDQLGAIEHADLPQPLEVALLDRGDLVVEDDQTGVVGGDRRADLLGLAEPMYRAGVGAGAVADDALDHLVAADAASAASSSSEAASRLSRPTATPTIRVAREGAFGVFSFPGSLAGS